MSSAAIRATWFPPTATSVVVATGARLHFGLMGVRAETGRRYGGIGLMVARPGCRLRVTTAPHDAVTASPDWSARITTWRDKLRAVRDSRPAPPVHITLEQALPEHRGYGSGTQTALATGTALAAAWEWPGFSAQSLAACLGRGGRSTIGTVGFSTGGLLVDAGHRSDESESRPAVTHSDLPGDWRVLLVEPKNGVGVSGEAESRAFGQLPPMPSSLTDRLCQLVLLEVLPAAASGNLETFARGLAQYGRLVGEYFSAAQGGGVLASPIMTRLDQDLIVAGHPGLVQTSWGPAAIAFAENEIAARHLADFITAHSSPGTLETTITQPLASAASLRHINTHRAP